jgi:hypothetical protein
MEREMERDRGRERLREIVQYSSEAVLREKLLYAVRHCSSIDADQVQR